MTSAKIYYTVLVDLDGNLTYRAQEGQDMFSIFFFVTDQATASKVSACKYFTGRIYLVEPLKTNIVH
ncbi:hypothetical protein BOTCAL_0136g00280 [Botryotinia calthae]|uniref:Uncharacterized protein n=1 Tax=Botryotinia calthae TaxID=38488 RepID=A0A4Y8D406_9HELO|nr:hypothetical protein BOTCAL_0136g00280 [Botryotinia calthae]